MAPPQKVQSLRSSVKNTRPTAGTREPGELYTNWPDLQLGVINASKVATDLIAVRFFSATTNYATGDFVIHAGKGYRAKNPVVSGAFNVADWDTVTVSGDFEPPIAAGTTAQYWRGDKSWQTLDKNAVGLSQVDNTSDANKPVSSAEQTALNLKANIASPTFTGDPKAPTPAFPDNDTSIATTAYLTANYAPLLNPTLGGDPRSVTPPTADNDTSIATTAYVKANLAGYAPLDSPVFIGNPTAPTASPGDNDTTIATTAFVAAKVATVPPFPEAPINGLVYGRKDAAWATIVGGAVISDTAPGAPLQNGQLWFKSNTGDTFIYYDDGSSQQWVQQNVVPPFAIPENYTTKTAETRSRIVNGSMSISQENGSSAGTSTLYYGADQWFTEFVSSGTFTTQRVQLVTPNGSKDRYRATVTVADASLAAGDFLVLTQKIEGNRLADFRYGSASTKQSVLRFGFKAPAGTYSIGLGNSAGVRSWVANFTISAGQANADTEQVFIIPGDTSGTWLTDTSIGVVLRIGLAVGGSFQASAGWQSGNVFGTASNTNGIGVTNNVFELFDVGLYMDPESTGVPPKWVMPDEAEELRACMRYYQKLVVGFSAPTNTSGSYTAFGSYAITPRATPPALTGVSFVAAGFTAAAGTFNFPAGNSTIGFYENRVAGTGIGAGSFLTVVTVNSRM